MFSQLKEALLPSIIGIMLHKREKLTRKEMAAMQDYNARLKVINRKTKDQVAIALVGLIGSGKSSVSEELSRHIGATIIEGDEIRVELRRQNESYEKTRALAEQVADRVLRQGGNVILDSDFIDAKKRASLREKLKKIPGVKLHFLCAYCDLDVQVGRIISAKYDQDPIGFFSGARSLWSGDPKIKPAIVKLREMMRRIPLHYRWVNKAGGKWEIKNPPCKVLADIDTTNEKEWKMEVGEVVKK